MQKTEKSIFDLFVQHQFSTSELELKAYNKTSSALWSYQTSRRINWNWLRKWGSKLAITVFIALIIDLIKLNKKVISLNSLYCQRPNQLIIFKLWQANNLAWSNFRNVLFSFDAYQNVWHFLIGLKSSERIQKNEQWVFLVHMCIKWPIFK